jgi:hypothetical protein
MRAQQEKAKQQVEVMSSKTKFVFALVLVLLLIGFYLAFDLSIRNKKRNILE